MLINAKENKVQKECGSLRHIRIAVQIILPAI